MRALLINPESHSIELRLQDLLGDGLGLVDFKIGEDHEGKEQRGSYCFSISEARRMEDWFRRLVVELHRDLRKQAAREAAEKARKKEGKK